MKMTCDEVKTLLADYWSQTLDEAQELAFEAHTSSCERCRTEAERLGALWRNLALLPGSSADFEPGENVRSRFYDRLGAYRQGLESAPKLSLREKIFALWPRRPAWQMAISFALLAIGIGLGYEIRGGKTAAAPGDPELAQLRGEVSNMRQMVALSLLQQQSAGERLRGVTYAYQAPPSDTEVLSALLTTMNQDQNVNVRLAAVDALHRFGASPVTREAVVQSIRKQDNPLVQIALLDLLVDLKDRDAAPELAQLTNDGKIDSAVRQHAEWALGRLQ
jgi:hypothetical protein